MRTPWRGSISLQLFAAVIVRCGRREKAPKIPVFSSDYFELFGDGRKASRVGITCTGTSLTKVRKPASTLLHSGLLRSDVGKDNERFVQALSSRIGHVLHGLPFPRFAGNQHVDIFVLERESLCCKAGRAGNQCYLRELHGRVTHNSEWPLDPQLPSEFVGQLR